MHAENATQNTTRQFALRIKTLKENPSTRETKKVPHHSSIEIKTRIIKRIISVNPATQATRTRTRDSTREIHGQSTQIGNQIKEHTPHSSSSRRLPKTEMRITETKVSRHLREIKTKQIVTKSIAIKLHL